VKPQLTRAGDAPVTAPAKLRAGLAARPAGQLAAGGRYPLYAFHPYWQPGQGARAVTTARAEAHT